MTEQPTENSAPLSIPFTLFVKYFKTQVTQYMLQRPSQIPFTCAFLALINRTRNCTWQRSVRSVSRRPQLLSELRDSV